MSAGAHSFSALKLSEREHQQLAIAFICSDYGKSAMDWDKFTALNGNATVNAAKVSLYAVRKKIDVFAAANPDSLLSQATTPSSGRKQATATPRKRASAAAGTPSAKKPRAAATPKSKKATTELEDDDEDGFGDVDTSSNVKLEKAADDVKKVLFPPAKKEDEEYTAVEDDVL